VCARRGGCRPLQPTRPTPRRHRRQAIAPAGFGLLPVRSPLLRESSLFLGVLRCFSSPGALFGIAPKVPGRAPGGLPHSDIPGSLAASASPGHFAAWPRPSSAANAKASTMRPSCGFPDPLPRRDPSWPRQQTGTRQRDGPVRPPPRCPACAVPRWVRCGSRVCLCVSCVCCSSVRAGERTRAPPPHRSRCDVRLGSRHAPSRADIVPRPQNPTGSAWRLVKVPTTRRPSWRRRSRRREVVKPRPKPSPDLGRDLPTGRRSSDHPAGAQTRAAGMLADRRVAQTAGRRPPRWSRGDSNPGPPPCKGGALPAKLRPQLSYGPRAALPRSPPSDTAWPPAGTGGRAWTRTRDLGLIRAAL
jgi:hypothetical protein